MVSQARLQLDEQANRDECAVLEHPEPPDLPPERLLNFAPTPGLQERARGGRGAETLPAALVVDLDHVMTARDVSVGGQDRQSPAGVTRRLLERRYPKRPVQQSTRAHGLPLLPPGSSAIPDRSRCETGLCLSVTGAWRRSACQEISSPSER